MHVRNHNDICLRLGEQELAVALFRRQLLDPLWNASFVPYWKSLPELGTLMSKEVWDNAEHRELLQNDYMVRCTLVNIVRKCSCAVHVCVDTGNAKIITCVCIGTGTIC